VAGHRLLIGRAQGSLFAYLDRCPHAGAPLSQGQLSGRRLRCARHGWTFDVLTGESLPEPSAFRLAAVPIKIEGAQVFARLESPSA
jgi:nitrite reductase (NADH) small subunit